MTQYIAESKQLYNSSHCQGNICQFQGRMHVETFKTTDIKEAEKRTTTFSYLTFPNHKKKYNTERYKMKCANLDVFFSLNKEIEGMSTFLKFNWPHQIKKRNHHITDKILTNCKAVYFWPEFKCLPCMFLFFTLPH